MPIPNHDKLLGALNQIQTSIKSLQGIKRGLTSNPDTDRLIGESYANLIKD
jgi:hypothetical protein